MSYHLQGGSYASSQSSPRQSPSSSHSPQAATKADGGVSRPWWSRWEIVEWLSSLVSGKIYVPGLCFLELDAYLDDSEWGSTHLVLFLAQFSAIFRSNCSGFGSIGGSYSGPLLCVFGFVLRRET
jgi:hypothetical protein